MIRITVYDGHHSVEMGDLGESKTRRLIGRAGSVDEALSMAAGAQDPRVVVEDRASGKILEFCGDGVRAVRQWVAEMGGEIEKIVAPTPTRATPTVTVDAAAASGASEEADL